MCVCERERVCVCERERKRKYESERMCERTFFTVGPTRGQVCVCLREGDREREREREGDCVSVCVRERVCERV